jgi:hypothetical protein
MKLEMLVQLAQEHKSLGLIRIHGRRSLQSSQSRNYLRMLLSQDLKQDLRIVSIEAGMQINDNDEQSENAAYYAPSPSLGPRLARSHSNVKLTRCQLVAETLGANGFKLKCSIEEGIQTAGSDSQWVNADAPRIETLLIRDGCNRCRRIG